MVAVRLSVKSRFQIASPLRVTRSISAGLFTATKTQPIASRLTVVTITA
jgi:hypothetical protein